MELKANVSDTSVMSLIRPENGNTEVALSVKMEGYKMSGRS
jgi:hypothetical protein